MAIYNKLYGAAEWMAATVRRSPEFSLFRLLKQQQYLPRKNLEAIQLQKLNGLLRHAIQHSAFYQKRLGSTSRFPTVIDNLAQLSKLPLLTRGDLQSHSEEIVWRGEPSRYCDSSGGSIGRPVNFFHDKHYRVYGNALQRLFLSWIGVEPGDKTALFWGADRDLKEMRWRDRVAVHLSRTLTLNSFDIQLDKLDSFLRRLEQFKPTYIVGYASSLELAANRINELGITSIRPKAVRSSAEMLYGYQRSTIERAFNCPVFDFYGSREVNNLAAECGEHAGKHVMAPGRIIEVVDDEGRALPNGEVGNIAVTDLTNYSFPFIRYLNGDRGSLAAETCSCGRSFPLLSEIVGRSSDILSFFGHEIHGEFFTHLFYSRPEVKQFQVVQESAASLTVRISPVNEMFDVEPILEAIRSQVGGPISIRMEWMDSIPVEASGKYRFTINKLRNQTVKELTT